MKKLIFILLSCLLAINYFSCENKSTSKKTTTAKEVKIKKAFLTLNFGDSKKVVEGKLRYLQQDGNIYKSTQFENQYIYLFDINKYGIKRAMAYITPHYYRNKLYKVELTTLPFESDYQYSQHIQKQDLDGISAPFENIKLYRDLHLAISQLYIYKYGKYSSQIESDEAEGLFNRYWNNDNIRIEIEIVVGSLRINYIDNDIIKLIKGKKISTKDAI
tara:strand:+ start:796 stop:1446 length:651 start_codon:yes stop_codon:yes gene_type:complete